MAAAGAPRSSLARSDRGRALVSGILYALIAGLLWGLVFIAPVLLPEYPAAVLSVGRYIAFGLIALPLAVLDRRAIARLSRADWIEAARLSLVGNLVYYGFLAAAIQTADAPLPTMIIGTLPVVIAVSSNLAARELPWRRLAGSLVVIAAGIALVNREELRRLATLGGDTSRLALGAALATGAVACWTWYPIRNARWLKDHPWLGSATWATAQGLTTLPLALGGALILAVWYGVGGLDAAPVAMGGSTAGEAAGTLPGERPFAGPLGPRPAFFVGLMLVIGLAASWLGTLCWNRASKQLPTSLAGQLIVFETLSALAYAFAWRGEAPSAATAVGIGMLVLGVVLGVRAFQRPAASSPP